MFYRNSFGSSIKNVERIQEETLTTAREFNHKLNSMNFYALSTSFIMCVYSYYYSQFNKYL